MKKQMIWDIPIRIFHWAFAFSCAGALVLGLLVDDDSAVFPVHMLLGIAACFLLIVRLALAVFGSRHNRLAAMLFSPLETLRYMGGVITGFSTRYFVHNPGTSAVALGMSILVVLLFWTGLDSAGEAAEDFHEMFAYALLVLIVAHVAGLVIHTLRHRENLSLSMITGFKQGPPENRLRSSHPVAGFLVLLVTLAWIGSLFANYNPANMTVRLPLLTTTIHLGGEVDNDHGHKTKSNDASKDVEDSEDDD